MHAPLPRYFFAPGATPDSVFGPLDDANTSRPLLHPARVSWPTSNLTRDRGFFLGTPPGGAGGGSADGSADSDGDGFAHVLHQVRVRC